MPPPAHSARRFHRLATASALVVSAWASPVVANLLHVVPADAPAVLHLRNVPELARRIEASPTGRSWQEDSVQRFFAPAIQQWKEGEWRTEFREKTGLTAEEVLEIFRGEVVVALTGLTLPAPGEEQGSDPKVSGLLVADVTGQRDRLVGLLKKAREGTKATVETAVVLGEEITVLQPPTPPAPEVEEGMEAPPAPVAPPPVVWAVVGERFVLGSPRSSVEAAVRALKADRPEGVASTTGWRRVAARLENADATAYLNFAPLAALLEERILLQGGEGNPMAPDGKSIVRALRLGVFQEFYFMTRYDDRGETTVGGVNFSETVGLAKLLAVLPPVPKAPRFFPADVPAVQTDSFDFGAFYDALMELIGNLNPLWGGMVDGYVRKFENDHGVNLRRDVFANLGPAVHSATLLRAGEEAGETAAGTLDTLYVMAVKDVAALESAIAALKGLGGPEAAERLFESYEVDGRTIHRLTQSIPQPRGEPLFVSYLLSDGHLFIGVGSDQILRQTAQSLARPGPSVYEQPKLRARIERLPANAHGYAYYNLRRLLPPVLRLIQVTLADEARKTAEAAEGEEGAVRPPAMVDPTVTIDTEAVARFWGDMFSHSRREANGLVTEIRVEYPAP